jgi:thiamine-phosphate pyrophosphorylase
MKDKIKITGGLYLVIDPAPGISAVLPKVEAAIRGGVNVLQIWNNWHDGQDAVDFTKRIYFVARRRAIPVLIHENIELMKMTRADAMHFDNPAIPPYELQKQLGREIIYGITCANDLERVRWAANQTADYVSFCSMYASSSVNTCDLVSLETVRKARQLASFPIFASGGITPENSVPVLESGANGIAVISGILKADDPEAAAKKYVEVIKNFSHKRPKEEKSPEFGIHS